MRIISTWFVLLFLIVSSSNAQNNQGDLIQRIQLSEKLFNQKLYDSAYGVIRNASKNSLTTTSDSLVIATLLQRMMAASQAKSSEVDSLYTISINKSAEASQWELLAETYFTRGRIFYREKDFGQAQSYFVKVDSIATLKGILNTTIIRAVLARSEISRTTFTYDGVELASDLQEKALELAKQLKNEPLTYDIYMRLADMNGLKGNLPEVRKYLDLAFPYFKATNNHIKMNRLYFTETSYYYDLNDLINAEKTIQESIDYFLQKDAKPELASAYVTYGNFYRKRRNDCAKAIPQFKKAQNIYELLGEKLSDRYMYLVEGMALCEAENGNFKDAYGYYQETYETKKQLVKNANNALTLQLETKYQSEKKEQEIALLQAQNETVEAQKKNQRNLLLGGIGLTSIAGIFLFFGFRNRKKINNKLRELDTLKSSFFENISHEFRTPLALIAGPVEQQLQKPDIDPSEKKNLTIAQRNTKRLLTLVDQLLDLSKLETGHFKLKVQQGNLSLFLKSLTSSFDYLAQESNQTYTVNINIPENSYYFDADTLEKIVTNLISNAIKYSPDGEAIEIAATIQDQKLQLTVKNSGAPLSQEALQTIFNRFERIDEQTAGTGIGLALSKELVSLHKGIINAHSKDSWTTFTITVPVTKTAFSETEKVKVVMAETASANLPSSQEGAETSASQDEIIQEEPDIFSKDTQPILLIVDDNPDLRTYVSSLFEDQYTIHTAQDGTEGFEIASSIVPDLIITDLMMPKDDGITLTRNCKTNEATSHIPIIMLTAKAGDENQLIGLETGADAYITKPFNTEILKTTAHNLLDTRRKLQERFSQEVVLIPKDMAVNSVDERFLDNLKEVVDTQIIESDFTTESFAKALGMSRMQLHRKLKALTGLSSTEFIRSQRLKLAAQLLKKSEINVSQVGYAVGFNNHSYFTKCFKEQYGISPSDYAKKS